VNRLFLLSLRLIVLAAGLGPAALLAGDGSRVQLRAASFDPLRDGAPPLDDRLPRGPRLRDVEDAAPAWLVQFHGPVTAEVRDDLARAGATVVGYVPDRTLLVRIPVAHAGTDVLGIPGSRWSGPLKPAYRLAPDVLERLQEPAGDAVTGLALDVLLFPGTAPDPIVAAIARRWPGVGVVHVKRGGWPRLALDVPAADAAPVTGSLARDPDVLFVSPRAPLELHNDNGVWISQSYDRVEGPVEAAEPDPKAYAISATVWNRGLRGEGQVIAVADTGLEYGMCYFDDPGHPVAPQTVAPPGPLALDATHRKLLALNAPLAGSLLFDDSFRHGTHVSGVAVGDDLAHPANDAGAGHDHADGVAPAARLVFEDISGGVNSVCSTSIVVGSVENLLEQQYAAGARISNNSWGSAAAGGFDALTWETDAAAWSHEDMLVVVSAGNNGGAGVAGLSLCKNCVAVGASETYDATFVDEFGILDPENMTAFSSRGPAPDGRIKPDVSAPGYIVASSRFPVTYVEDEDDPQCDGPDVCLPSFGGCYVTDSAETCHADGLLGTSMASPAVAGMAALARQYFVEGFHPSGHAVPADALVPSAALLKAVLINGARNMTGRLYERRGTPQDFGPLADAPSNVQGWGRAMLDDALHFTGDARTLFLLDVPNAAGLSGVESIDVTLAAGSPSEPLKATLVWSDVAALPVSAEALVNDLDLVVTAPGGTAYRGNQWTPDNPGVPGDKASAPDAPGADGVNNVEGVLVPAPPPGVYRVSVRAADVPLGPQGGALVVTGAVAPCTATPAPQDVEVVSVAAGQVDLSWDPVPGAIGYAVRRNSSACGNPMAADQVFAVPGGQTSFADTTVSALSDYHYTVRAVVSPDGCETEDGVCVQATTPPPAPPDVQGLIAERRNVSGARIDVYWDAAGCPAPGRHLLYGDLAGVETPAPLGAKCGLPPAGLYHWLDAPPGNLWFLVVADDGDATEGSWGQRSDGTERNDGEPSLLCGMLLRDDTGDCP
jgi:hypothetical protein